MRSLRKRSEDGEMFLRIVAKVGEARKRRRTHRTDGLGEGKLDKKLCRRDRHETEEPQFESVADIFEC